jgi:HEPN domain-containing protein
MRRKSTGLRCMSAPDRPVGPENRREARRWLAIVAEDIDVADAAVRLSVPRPGASAFHLQQAAEKLFKSLLVLAGEPFRRTHDLADLAARLMPLYPQFAGTFDALRHLTIWGVAYRYPALEDEPEPLPGVLELERYAELLRAFAAEVGACIEHDDPTS